MLQFATVEVAVTFIKDEFGPKILRFLKREELLTLAVCAICFLLGIPHVTKVRQSKTLLAFGLTYLRMLGSLQVATFTSLVTGLMSFQSFSRFCSSPLCTGRYLCVSADGPLHSCGFPRVPGFL